jgi:hypothetical protein
MRTTLTILKVTDGQHKTRHYNMHIIIIIIIIIQIHHISEQAEKTTNTAGRIADNLAQVRTPDIPNTKQVYVYREHVLQNCPLSF